MTETTFDEPPEPTGFLVVLPGKRGERFGMGVGPFEDRQAAQDFADEFMWRVDVTDGGLLIGAMYAPDFILSVVLDTQERKARGE